jgi:PAS domain S-box-containing protein
MIEASLLPVAIVGSDCVLREVNPAFADLLGYLPDELRRLTLGDISDAAEAGAVDTVLSGRELVRRATSRFVTRSGTEITAATIAFRLDSGDAVALILLEHEVAARRFGASEAARRAFPD